MPEKPPPPRRRPTAAAGSWVRSLHCKSMAADDVAARVAAPPPKRLHPLLPRAGCGSSGDALSHVASSKHASSGARPKPGSGSKPSAYPGKKTKTKPASVVPPSPPPGPLGPVPALTELPAGHSSRQVVEIIFLSSWSSPLPFPVPQPPPNQPGAPTNSSGGGAFPGVVEMLFRVHNPARAVARFEDYRAAVRARAGGAARSAADGNEMMRFSPAPPYGSSPAAAAGGEDAPRIRTFDGSGGAHASGRGPAAGRRAMFLCRVIAGRVAEPGASSEPKEHFDSARVAGKGGELVVFDRRAVLPCFLIIYRL
ncbi:skin secretory protein xP2-like [Panicum virgatum]|uniref:Uncharacterized protein n=1 Tax=Panicum virgatum TaxID=38727 RepID=A0A8T0XBN6_PANVG|nr:skin secretory protein xP2-like [Panicum virgatum]KAG2652849.1 hypothetical protein PVAP13_1NG388219 [Panicum virgatum]